MGRINTRIDDDLDRQVRMEIAKRGGKKGDITKAIEEGLRLWLKRQK